MKLIYFAILFLFFVVVASAENYGVLCDKVNASDEYNINQSLENCNEYRGVSRENRNNESDIIITGAVIGLENSKPVIFVLGGVTLLFAAGVAIWYKKRSGTFW